MSLVTFIKRVFLFLLFCLFVLLISVTTIKKNDKKSAIFHTYLSGMLVIFPEHRSITKIVPRDEIDRVTTIDGVLYYYPYLRSPGTLRGRKIDIIGIDQNIPGAEDAYRFYKIKEGKNLSFSTAKVVGRSKKMPDCLMSINLKRSLETELGATLQFKTFKCRVIGITKSDHLVSANYVITSIDRAQSELIESEHLYRFLHARSVEAVSCGKCHTVMTEAIKKATKEAAEVFEDHSLTSGAFVVYKSKADPDAIAHEVRKRIRGVEVVPSEELNYKRIWYYSK